MSPSLRNISSSNTNAKMSNTPNNLTILFFQDIFSHFLI